MSKPNFAKDQLKSIVERVERLEEEKTALSGDIREVYAEAKGNGFDTKIVRQVVRLRKMDASEREERDALIDLYMSALGQGSLQRDMREFAQKVESVTTDERGVPTITVKA